MTVNWHLDTDTDATAYFDLWWELDGRTMHEYSDSEWRRTQLRTARLSPGSHTIEVTTENMVWTDHYYSTGDCEVSGRDDYLFYCGWDDTATVTVSIR